MLYYIWMTCLTEKTFIVKSSFTGVSSLQLHDAWVDKCGSLAIKALTRRQFFTLRKKRSVMLISIELCCEIRKPQTDETASLTGWCPPSLCSSSGRIQQPANWASRASWFWWLAVSWHWFAGGQQGSDHRVNAKMMYPYFEHAISYCLLAALNMLPCLVNCCAPPQ